MKSSDICESVLLEHIFGYGLLISSTTEYFLFVLL